MNRYLIVGLGNPGSEYENTRHNIGFRILNAFADSLKIKFEPSRLAFAAIGKIKNKTFVLIKPATFMNLSGRAVNYYLQKEKIPLSNLLVLTDDVTIPLGKIRIRSKGSDGGHNGLSNINKVIGSGNYPRLRFGIGNEYPKGWQVNYVLGEWSDDELKIIQPRIELAAEAVKDFGMTGVEKTMNSYNNK